MTSARWVLLKRATMRSKCTRARIEPVSRGARRIATDANLCHRRLVDDVEIGDVHLPDHRAVGTALPVDDDGAAADARIEIDEAQQPAGVAGVAAQVSCLSP